MNYDFSNARGVERRTFAAELRTDAGDEFALIGRAASYGVQSKNLGGFRETIQRGAFARSVRGQNQGEGVVCLFNHDPSQILGRTTAGTLKVTDESDGLYFRCQLDKNQQSHRDLYSSVKRGDVRACSFSFTVPKGGQSWQDGRDPETGEACAFRTLTDVELFDVSPVVAAAYPQTELGARAQQNPADYNPDTDPDPVRASVGRAARTVQLSVSVRRLAQIYAREFRTAILQIIKRDSPTIDYSQPGFMGRMAAAHAMAEMACMFHRDAKDAFGAMSPDDEDWPDEETQEGFRMAGAHAELCAQEYARARAAYGRKKKK